LDPNALAEELIKMYTENNMERKDIIKMILPQVKDLDEFKGMKDTDGWKRLATILSAG
jgi:hypothetical protein